MSLCRPLRWLLIGLGAAIPAAGYGQDVTPPTVVEVSFSPQIVDVSVVAQGVTVTARIVDIPAGVQQVNFRFTSGNSTATNETVGRTSGTPQDGVYQRTLTIPAFIDPGTYSLSIFVLDQAGNHRWIEHAELSAAGFPTDLEVVSTTIDNTLPSVVELDFMPGIVDVSEMSRGVTITARLVDTPAGVKQVNFRFSRGNDVVANEQAGRTSGTAQDGVYKHTLTIPAFTDPGIYSISIFVLDQAGNFGWIEHSALQAAGFLTDLIIVSETTDNQMPSVIGLSFVPQIVDVSSAPQTVTVAARVLDAPAGTQQINFRFAINGTVAANEQARRIAGTAQDGIYERALTIPPFIVPGVYQLSVFALDQAGNFGWISSEVLASLGFDTDLTVLLPDISVIPAVLNFGDVGVGEVFRQLVTISNEGTTTGVISAVSVISGTGAFGLDGSLSVPVMLGAGEHIFVEVSFSPTAEGSDHAVLVVGGTDPDQPIVEVLLEGIGVLADPTDQLADILTFFDQAVLDGTLVGSGPGGSAGRRLNALRNKLEAAGDLLDRGLTNKACNVLLDAFFRTDGVFPPPDFVGGTAAPELAARIQTLRTSLACEVKCGDVDREADIDQDDIHRVRRYVARDKPDPPFELPRCSVKGGERDCDLVDVVVLRRRHAELQVPIEDVCQTKVLDVP